MEAPTMYQAPPISVVTTTRFMGGETEAQPDE